MSYLERLTGIPRNCHPKDSAKGAKGRVLSDWERKILSSYIGPLDPEERPGYQLHQQPQWHIDRVLGIVAKEYRPGCLEWITSNREDLFAEIKACESEIEQTTLRAVEHKVGSILREVLIADLELDCSCYLEAHRDALLAFKEGTL